MSTHEVSVTVSAVRLSPDFRHAIVFVEPLGAGLDANNERAERLLRFVLSPQYIELRNHLGMGVR